MSTPIKTSINEFNTTNSLIWVNLVLYFATQSLVISETIKSYSRHTIGGSLSRVRAFKCALKLVRLEIWKLEMFDWTKTVFVFNNLFLCPIASVLCCLLFCHFEHLEWFLIEHMIHLDFLDLDLPQVAKSRKATYDYKKMYYSETWIFSCSI